MRTRHALEEAVHGPYEHDRDLLRMPYDNGLNLLVRALTAAADSSEGTADSEAGQPGGHGD